jgi:NitT/TauT family transport system ATP-binding protein
MEVLVKAEEACLEYYQVRSDQKVLALDGVNLEVNEGEFLSIVGPSGCGKSTFLNIVDGLLEPTSGKIYSRNRLIEGPGPDRAVVFQSPSLLPWRTVLRNVSYGLECQNTPVKKAISTAQKYIELVGLNGFENHYPHELSGGMQQRGNLARALSFDPELLLMDEPFASLDAQTREIMQSELLSIWQKTKKTVLFVTHQINEAIYLSDRVIIFSARPGHVKASVEIDLPRPRDFSTKRTKRFVEYEDYIWREIEQEVKKGMY